MLISDVHFELGMNALEWNRDYTRPLDEIREREQGLRAIGPANFGPGQRKSE